MTPTSPQEGMLGREGGSVVGRTLWSSKGGEFDPWLSSKKKGGGMLLAETDIAASDYSRLSVSPSTCLLSINVLHMSEHRTASY